MKIRTSYVMNAMKFAPTPNPFRFICKSIKLNMVRDLVLYYYCYFTIFPISFERIFLEFIMLKWKKITLFTNLFVCLFVCFTLELARSDENVKKFFDMSCDKCPVEFTNLLHARRHYREHGINKGYIKCCERKFNQRGTVNEHVMYHLNPDIFKYVFEHQPFLVNWSKNHQTIYCHRSNRCSVCGRVCTTRISVKNCKLKHQALEKGELTCDICGRVMANKATFKEHKKTHEKREPVEATLPCDQCYHVYVTITVPNEEQFKF